MTTDSPEFENIPTPKLTLEPDLTEDGNQQASEANQIVIEATEVVSVPKDDAPLAEESLTEEEKLQVQEFAKQIDISNSQQIMTYGAGAQRKMADFSSTALEKVRTEDLGDAGKLISDVVVELKSFDAEESKGIFGFFKRQANKVVALKARYDKAEANVNKIVKALENHQLTLMKDAAMLDKLYELNLTYFKELTMYLAAGRQKLSEVRTGQLQELTENAKASNKAEDIEQAQKLEAACNRFEKKLSDLDITRTIAMQMAPQIRLVQANEMLMTEKIQTTLVNTIPLWKSQMVLALGIANNEAALKAQSAVSDMTNELLKKNAETLKQSTINVAKESERSIVDLDTLRATNENLIQTFDEVMKIQEEGRAKRAETEVELRRMEQELKQKLLSAQN